jgi:hypothetical protein
MPKIQRFILICALALALTAISRLFSPAAQAGSFVLQDPTTEVSTPNVRVLPALAEVPMGEAANLQVAVEDPTNLYAFEIHLTFDPDVIQVQDANGDQPGVQLHAGPLLAGKQYFVATNRADNEAGTIHFVAGLLGNQAPIIDSGTLITMTVQGHAPGTSPLAFDDVMLMNRAAEIIASNAFDAVIVVPADPTTVAQPTHTPTATVTPTPQATGAPTSTSTAPSPQATPTPTATSTAPSPQATPTPTATSTLTPQTTATPAATAELTATPTPTLASGILETKFLRLPLLMRNHHELAEVNP